MKIHQAALAPNYRCNKEEIMRKITVSVQTREYIESIAAPARSSGSRRPASAAEEAENER